MTKRTIFSCRQQEEKGVALSLPQATTRLALLSDIFPFDTVFPLLSLVLG